MMNNPVVERGRDEEWGEIVEEKKEGGVTGT